MSEERAHILRMISEGTLSAEEGAKLLDAAQATGSEPPAAPAGRASWFRVRVTDLATGRAKVNVSLPIGLVKAGLKIGARFAPEVDELDLDEIVLAVQEGAAGKIVEVEDEDSGEKVEVFLA